MSSNAIEGNCLPMMPISCPHSQRCWYCGGFDCVAMPEYFSSPLRQLGHCSVTFIGVTGVRRMKSSSFMVGAPGGVVMLSPSAMIRSLLCTGSHLYIEAVRDRSHQFSDRTTEVMRPLASSGDDLVVFPPTTCRQ